MQNYLLISELNSGLLIEDKNPLLSLFQMVLYGSSSTPLKCSYYDTDGAVATENNAKTSIIPLIGAMSKYCMTEYVSNAIVEHSDKGIGVIVLQIDSGGGTVTSVAPVLKSIDYARSMGVKIYASVDCCCSAAYWVASACDGIYADNDISSRIGSIGAMCQYLNTDNLFEKIGVSKIDYYSKMSLFKNEVHRKLKEGDESLLVKEIDESANKFIADVQQRRVKVSNEDGVFQGRVFSAERAKELGLIDGVMSLNQLILLINI